MKLPVKRALQWYTCPNRGCRFSTVRIQRNIPSVADMAPIVCQECGWRLVPRPEKQAKENS